MNDQTVAVPTAPLDMMPVLLTWATAGSVLPHVAGIPVNTAPAASSASA